MRSERPEQRPETSDWRHDTAVIAMPDSGADSGSPGVQVPGVPPGWSRFDAAGQLEQGNQEAEYWRARFRRQRRWTWLLGSLLFTGLLLIAGSGLFVWKVVVPRVASSVTLGLDGALPSWLLPDGLSDGSAGPHSGGTTDGGLDLSEVPLPEALQGLGSILGIDDIAELLDTVVSMGLMTQEQADQIRDAVGSGESLDGLLGIDGQAS